MSKGYAFFALFIAILFGILASMLVIQYLKQMRSQAPVQAVATEPAETQAVVLVKNEIPIGTKIKADDLAEATRPKDLIPAGVVLTVTDAVGKEAQSTLYPGEILILFRLSQDEASLSLTSYIPSGYRALTLQVDESSGVAGFIQPGHFVDVISTFTPQEGSGGTTFTKVILQNVKVLARGEQLENSVQRSGRAMPNVTVMVTLAQAEKLTLADTTARVRLVLRNPEDQENVPTDGADLVSIFGTGTQELPPPEEVKTETLPAPVTNRTVEILRGSEKTEQVFPLTP